MEIPRLVRTHHAVRTVSFLCSFLVIGLHFWERGAGLAAWLLLALQFLVYPHAVYLRARHSAKPLRAVLDNLFFDSALLGVWCAALGFPAWISYALVSATTLNAMVNGGTRGALWS